MYHNTFLNKKKSNPGFGLIELLVSVSIMVLVIGVVLSQNSSFNAALLLRGQAYEIALHAREVQLFAVSVTGDGSGGSTDFRKVHGLHFDTGSPNSYKVFLDKSIGVINFYDAGEEFGTQGNVDPRFEIEAMSLIGTAITPTQLSVIFERPNFDARFFKAGGVEDTTATAVKIDLRLRGTTGTGVEKVRTVEITRTGQISVI
jgi:type II secretory pathway pseudopilin PulG